MTREEVSAWILEQELDCIRRNTEMQIVRARYEAQQERFRLAAHFAASAFSVATYMAFSQALAHSAT